MKLHFFYIFFCLVLLNNKLFSQVYYNPTVVYHGENYLTITCPDGIKSVDRYDGGIIFSSWKAITPSYENKDFKVISISKFNTCPKQVNLKLLCKALGHEAKFKLRVTTCKNKIYSYDYVLAGVWNVYKEEYGNVELGTTKCHTFQVYAQSESVRLDSIASPSPEFKIKYTMKKPPIIIPPRTTYKYEVCYTPSKLGRFKCPIFTYIRREQPAGGLYTFVVSDTGYATVVLPKNQTPPIAMNKPTQKPIQKPLIKDKPIATNLGNKPVTKPVTQNRSNIKPPPILIPKQEKTISQKKIIVKPKVIVENKKNIPKKDNIAQVQKDRQKILPKTSVPDSSEKQNTDKVNLLNKTILQTIAIEPTSEKQAQPKQDFVTKNNLQPITIIEYEDLQDPTIFRMLATPTANPVGEGKLAVGNYEVAGWVANYGLTEDLTLIGAAVYLPQISKIPQTFFGSIGAKYQLYNQGFMRFSGGAQLGFTANDTSNISLIIPYLTATYGNEDQRINFNAGYNFRNHRKPNDNFFRYSPVATLGFDYRFAKNFKLVLETALLENADSKPFVATCRYFGKNYSIDLGCGANIDSENNIIFAPILNAFYIW